MINFTVIFFFILDAKPWGKIPSGTERWCWSACMSFSTTKLETNKSHWRRDWQCVVVSKTKIIIHNDWRYLSMVHQCLKASFHSCAVFGRILYNTVIWILWSKQSQFPLVIYDHSNHKLKSCGLSAYVASVSVWFWSKKRGTRVKDHPISFLGSCSIFHTAKIKNLALLRNHMETLATQASGLRALFYTCNTWIQSLTILKCHNRLGRFRLYPCAKLQQCGYPV